MKTQQDNEWNHPVAGRDNHAPLPCSALDRSTRGGSKTGKKADSSAPGVRNEEPPDQQALGQVDAGRPAKVASSLQDNSNRSLATQHDGARVDRILANMEGITKKCETIVV